MGPLLLTEGQKAMADRIIHTNTGERYIGQTGGGGSGVHVPGVGTFH
jgi:hypothetical protein